MRSRRAPRARAPPRRSTPPEPRRRSRNPRRRTCRRSGKTRSGLRGPKSSAASSGLPTSPTWTPSKTRLLAPCASGAPSPLGASSWSSVRPCSPALNQPRSPPPPTPCAATDTHRFPRSEVVLWTIHNTFSSRSSTNENNRASTQPDRVYRPSAGSPNLKMIHAMMSEILPFHAISFNQNRTPFSPAQMSHAERSTGSAAAAGGGTNAPALSRPSRFPLRPSPRRDSIAASSSASSVPSSDTARTRTVL
mmetsp:Transcript_28614/g.93476  ORF Transcript_28614/g.93476 Transcript_28614/m.93476 type:complete len:249 (-) Transcript_28614:1895-2641(-)